MKRIYHLFFLLFFTLTCDSIHAQNLIYQKVEQAKNNGKKFDLVKDVFTRTESNREVLRAFKNADEVNFMSYNPSSIDELPMTISIEVLLDNKMETLELMAVDNDFYNYVVTTSANESFGANRDIKHYRGVLKGNASSLAAVSFSKDHVGGVIANGKGNYNISLQKKINTIAIFNENNLLDTPKFECGTIDDGMSDYDPNILNMESKTALASNEKCVRIYYEAEYDIFENKGSVPDVENYLSTIFNQVALLYENENITTTISELKIWTTTDPFTESNTLDLRNQFQSHTSSINGDLGQLLTFRIGGGIAAGFNGLCNSNVDEKLSVSGLHTDHLLDATYSWNVALIAHELGHTFGSRHTHACVWNGNNTAIDGCAGKTEGGCGLPGLPTGGGTIMSYCDATSVGIDFARGFGPQPGNVIRSRVSGASCLNGCATYCFDNLTLTSNVPSFYFDKRTVNYNIIATNKVEYGAYAEYSAGNSVLLKPGFRSHSGSNSHIYIEGCYLMQELGNSVAEADQFSASKELFKEELSVNLYPNPTPDLITIESNHEIIFWELTNDVGNMYRSGKVDNLKKFQLNFADLSMGIYNIKIHLANGEVSYKKMIKQ